MYDIFYSYLNSLKLQISQMASIEKNQDISLQIMTSIKTDSNAEGQIKINANLSNHYIGIVITNTTLLYL
jgi:hypothetical protein